MSWERIYYDQSSYFPSFRIRGACHNFFLGEQQSSNSLFLNMVRTMFIYFYDTSANDRYYTCFTNISMVWFQGKTLPWWHYRRYTWSYCFLGRTSFSVRCITIGVSHRFKLFRILRSSAIKIYYLGKLQGFFP